MAEISVCAATVLIKRMMMSHHHDDLTTFMPYPIYTQIDIYHYDSRSRYCASSPSGEKFGSGIV